MAISVRDRFNRDPAIDVEEALRLIIRAERDGELETLRDTLDNLIELVVDFIAPQIQSAEDLNNLVGWDRFIDNK